MLDTLHPKKYQQSIKIDQELILDAAVFLLPY